MVINFKGLPRKMTLNIRHGNGVPIVVRERESRLRSEQGSDTEQGSDAEQSSGGEGEQLVDLIN